MNKFLKSWMLLSGLMVVMAFGSHSVLAQGVVIIDDPIDFSYGGVPPYNAGQSFSTKAGVKYTVNAGTVWANGGNYIQYFRGWNTSGDIFTVFNSEQGHTYEIKFSIINQGWSSANDHGLEVSAIDGSGIGRRVLGRNSLRLNGSGTIQSQVVKFTASSTQTTIRLLGLLGDRNDSRDLFLTHLRVVDLSGGKNNPPVAKAGRDITVEAPSLKGASVTLDGTDSYDPDKDELHYSWVASGVTFDNANSPTPTGVFPIGVTQAVLYVEDGNGGKAKDAVSITVLKPKNNPPVAHAGPDQIVEATSSAGASVTLDGTVSKDKDGDKLRYSWFANGVTFDNANSPTPAGVFPIGATQAVLTVDDGKGGKAKDDVLIQVVDTTPPDVSFSLSTNTLWPANHKMVQVASGISASDIVDGDVSVKIIVKSDEDINGSGDGNTEVDWEISGGDVYLRAERDGGQDGRVYTVTVVATDAAGNTTKATGTVEVPHSQQVASADNNGKAKGRAKKIVVVQQSVIPPVIAGATPEIAGLLVDVAGQADVAPQVQIPVVENHTFSLSQNHPNPFNPETVIGYALGEASDVQLIIYNVLGQQVRELVNASQAPGQYSVRWDGRNALGAQVTSGVYIYRLVAGSQVEMRKMILLK